MKHIYNPTAAPTQRPSANATGTAAASKFFMLVLLSFFLLVSGESVGQTTTLYGTNRFNTLDNLYIQIVNGRIELASSQLRAYTATGNNAYNGYVAINNRKFNLKKGFTYTVSFSARAIDHSQGGVGNVSVLRGSSANTSNASEINWDTNSAIVLASGTVSKSAGTALTNYTITFKASANFDNQYLALKLSSPGGNQSDLYLDNLIIRESCAPNMPQVASVGSCSMNVPIVLTASGAVSGVDEYRWYTESTGGTAIENATGAQFTTPPLAQSKDYYVSIYNNETKCESARIAVTASVGGLLSPKVMMTTGSCDATGNETKVYTASGGVEGSYRWYSVSIIGSDTTLTQLNAPNGQSITGSTLERKTNSEAGSYAIRIVGEGCQSEPEFFSVDKTYPTAPTNNATGVICGNQLTLKAFGATFGQSYNWYATFDGETNFIGRGTILVTTALEEGTIYTVSKVNISSGCESTARRTANVIQSPILQSNNITGNAIFCQGAIASYSVPSVDGATYSWTITPDAGITTAPELLGSSTNQFTVRYPNSDYRGTIKVTVSSACNGYISELEVQATNNNAATGEILQPPVLALNQPAEFKFETNVHPSEIERVQWFIRRTGSSNWEVGANTRDWVIQSMDGNIDGIRVAVRVKEVNSCFGSLGALSVGVTGFEANSFLIDNLPITPLPVELMFFKAQAQTKGINLTWATASELENKGFEVQVSYNGRDFKEIGFVESRVGTTSLRQDYSFLDTKAVSGTRYYRLKQVDLDGTTSFSPIRAIALDAGNGTVSAYPNPFDDAVIVTLNGTEARNVQVVLMDAMGKVLQQRTEETSGNSITVDMRSVTTKGMYVIHVLDNNTKHTFKLMKR